jgi:hypothetical protein
MLVSFSLSRSCLQVCAQKLLQDDRVIENEPISEPVRALNAIMRAQVHCLKMHSVREAVVLLGMFLSIFFRMFFFLSLYTL